MRLRPLPPAEDGINQQLHILATTEDLDTVLPCDPAIAGAAESDALKEGDDPLRPAYAPKSWLHTQQRWEVRRENIDSTQGNVDQVTIAGIMLSLMQFW